MKAALVGGGVALGAGSDVLLEAIRGGEEEPPLLMEGGQLAENRIDDESWNLFKFDTTNENFAEEEKIMDLQTTERTIPDMAAHNDLAHIHGHISSGHHRGDTDFII